MPFYYKPPAEEYTNKAKLKILEMLWDGEIILGDDILAAVKQAYYDRRIRELRDEDGWDIETTWLKNREGKKRPAYCLRSHVRGKGIKRPHISSEDRRIVLERDKYTCQIDGNDLRDGRNNPQIDHKIPLIRDGKSAVENYQAICSNCNVIKRGICRMCNLPSCENCFLAYPEKGANNVPINLTGEESNHLTKIANKLDVNRVEALRKIIKERLADYDT